jgi:2-octaprenyl-6-methoxyphenol hydroxylase
MPFLRKAIIEKVEDYIKNGVIKWIGNTTIQDINFDNPCAEVITENNEKFLSPCIVGADGRNSTTRNLANIQAKQKSYDQKAIVCTYKHSNDHNDMAYEIFLPSGPFAILPMTRKRSSVVWSLDQVIADTLLKEANEKIDFKITQLMAPYLSDLERIGKVWTYPLGLSYVNKYSVNRCALIGDAAHAIHPLAGQGVNLGFKDAAILAEIIANSIKLGIDYGTSSVLEQYDKWRKLDIYSLIIMTDSLNKLFSNSSKTLNFVRGKGLQLVNKMPFLKNSLENHAKGFSGKIPKLIKGEQLL